ncbi:MAG: antibiotic biosynthesis monooxygenase [Candidatus Nanopelagicales bacterium]|nr:antibiotic biosynthesis monooxygenase [Candidatus Nanopelagicales bacterium]
MPYVLIVHEVDDYEAWKRVFDDAAAMRKAAGEIDFQLLREQSSATHLVHFSQWSDLDAARAFFESDALVRIRREAGVHPPTFLYLEQLEAGTL